MNGEPDSPETPDAPPSDEGEGVRAHAPLAADPAPADPAEPPIPRSLGARLSQRFPTLAPALRDLDGKAAWIMILAAVLLLVFRKFGGSGTFEHTLRPESLQGHHYLTVFGDYYWFLSCFVLLGVLPALASSPRALRPASLGLGLGDWRFGLKWVAILYAVMLPVVVIASRFSTFWQYYPLNDLLGREATQTIAATGQVPAEFWKWFVIYELLYALYFVGWEFFFRGWLTFGLYERLGVNGVFIGNIPFALMHLGKPFPEAMGSVVAGIALGLFALRARSFWYCWVLHAGIAWTMDVCAIQRKVEEALRAAAGG